MRESALGRTTTTPTTSSASRSSRSTTSSRPARTTTPRRGRAPLTVGATIGNSGIPYRIEIDGGPIVRCWDPHDASLLKSAIDSSLEHLRPLDAVGARRATRARGGRRRCSGCFAVASISGTTSSSGLLAGRDRVLGGRGLAHPGWRGRVRDRLLGRCRAVRQGIATTVAGALTRVGIELGGADRIEIRVDVDNELSCRIPRAARLPRGGDLRRRLPAADARPGVTPRVFSHPRRRPLGFAGWAGRRSRPLISAGFSGRASGLRGAGGGARA